MVAEATQLPILLTLVACGIGHSTLSNDMAYLAQGRVAFVPLLGVPLSNFVFMWDRENRNPSLPRLADTIRALADAGALPQIVGASSNNGKSGGFGSFEPMIGPPALFLFLGGTNGKDKKRQNFEKNPLKGRSLRRKREIDGDQGYPGAAGILRPPPASYGQTSLHPIECFFLFLF